MVRPWSPICVVAAMATSSIRSGGRLRVAAQQLADERDDEVVARVSRVEALGAGLAERGADAVDEDDLTDGAGGTGCCGHVRLLRRDDLTAHITRQ